MKLAIVTAGAVGAFFGGRFIRQGAAVRFVARGAHLQALRDQGITFQTSTGAWQVAASDYTVTEDAARAVQEADLVLFAVKSFDTAKVAGAMTRGLGAQTPVLSLQNGVENEETLAAIIGPERTAGGVAYVFANLEGPGQVVVPGNVGRLVLAEQTLTGQPLPHLEEFKQLCQEAQVPCETTPDIAKVKWTKLVFNSALNGWTTLENTTLDRLLNDPARREDFENTVRETAQVARAAGVNLDADVFEKTMALAASLGPVGSSMRSDFQHNRPLEVDGLNGAVVRKGQAVGVATPYNQNLVERLNSLSK